VEIKANRKEIFIMQEAIIEMLEKADTRKIRLIYFYVKALIGGCCK